MHQPDFIEGVTARLIERRDAKWAHPPSILTAPHDWVQKNIIDAGRFNESLADSFYILEEGKRESVAKERGLFTYSLPMEAGVLAKLMRGKMDGTDEDNVKFTRKEFVDFVIGENLGRAGAERKLNWILDMKTVTDDKGKLIWKFDQTS